MTADFLFYNNTIMPSKPNLSRVVIEISLYGRCEIHIWPELSKSVKKHIFKTYSLNSFHQTYSFGQ